MKFKSLIIICFILITVVFAGMAHAQDGRTSQTKAWGWPTSIQVGQSAFYFDPLTSANYQLIANWINSSGCAYYIFSFNPYHVMEVKAMQPNEILSEYAWRPWIQCLSPYGLIVVNSSYKDFGSKVFAPIARYRNQPYVPATPYP